MYTVYTVYNWYAGFVADKECYRKAKESLRQQEKK